MSDIILAVDDPCLRETISEALRSAEFSVTALPDSRALQVAAINSTQVVIIETNDDAVALTQRTYELYERLGDSAETIPGLIGIIGRGEMDRHDALRSWHIHGHAALDCLVMRESPNLTRELVDLARHLVRPRRR